MSIPVIQRRIQGLGQFVQGLESPALESQRAQLLPPGLDQVQPAGILRDELNLNFRPGSQREPGLATGVDAQVVLDNQPAVGWKLNHDMLQQLDVAGTISAGAQNHRRLPRGRFKGPVVSTFTC